MVFQVSSGFKTPNKDDAFSKEKLPENEMFPVAIDDTAQTPSAPPLYVEAQTRPCRKRRSTCNLFIVLGTLILLFLIGYTAWSWFSVHKYRREMKNPCMMDGYKKPFGLDNRPTTTPTTPTTTTLPTTTTTITLNGGQANLLQSSMNTLLTTCVRELIVDTTTGGFTIYDIDPTCLKNLMLDSFKVWFSNILG
uniref:Uncharacterized LOC100175668 n=1 Tax=Ciona intestinalis TaxID=7719 RepID=H2Y166_CIOIN|nr:uncharacterized protein LOC100175668 [Ciona intestinalis]|eukprot:XP_009860930.1 uncharacterized protein LOC100175668 [Ciona intestinalis]